ncbi:MAG: MOSC N-terminal beta barrel domain-containing protein [Solirubrobacteraceae bacterium]
MTLTAGTVLSLHRWPVKSMGGEPVTTFALDRDGVAGDRAHVVYDVHRGAPRRLTARQAPRLLAWQAGYGTWDGGVGAMPPATLAAPDGTVCRWDDADLPARLSDDLGRAVTLRVNPHGQPDLRESVLVTTRATHGAIERELGRSLDQRRWRTNVHVALDAPAFAEETWEGRTLTIGEASFALLHPCERCVTPARDPDTQEKSADLLRHLFRAHAGLFGMNARAHGPARIRVGDAVAVT